MKKKKMTLGWVVDSEKTPLWATGGMDPSRTDNFNFEFGILNREFLRFIQLSTVNFQL
jgi:hypothetical protein